MTTPPTVSDASAALARRLFSLASADAGDDAALLAASEHMWVAIADRLSRWFGPYGSLALITRALHSAQPHHRCSSCMTVSASVGSTAPSLAGLDECALRHGAFAASEASIAVVAALAELIGLLVGDDLAATLLEQSLARPTAAHENGGMPAGDRVPPTVNEP
jgi:hypothetical protein